VAENGKEKQNKGQFKKGSSGGPGRPKKKPHPIDTLSFWEATEEKIREVLESKDASVVVRGITASLKYLDLRAKYEAAHGSGSRSVIDPGVQQALGDQITKILAGDEVEVDDILDEGLDDIE
jgi:hypothetical protein